MHEPVNLHMMQYSLLISHRPRRPHPYGRCVVAWLQGRAELEAALIKAVVQLLKSVKKQTVCHLSSYPPKFTANMLACIGHLIYMSNTPRKRAQLQSRLEISDR